MPVTVTKQKSGLYKVETPNQVHSYGSTKANAEKQRRLLNWLDHDPSARKKLRESYKKK
jgi:hypothetical protein